MRRFVFVLLLLLGFSGQAAAAPPIVLAAASLQESLNAAADAWAKAGHERPTLSFAASSALARQIAAGAPADLFVSADIPWMDYVEQRKLVAPGTRIALLTNQLVLIAPAGPTRPMPIRRGFPLAAALGREKLAMADPDAVPAGLYGREALTKLGVWAGVAPKVARAENVRAALALVERGEAPYGIVYLTDALASPKVKVVGTFPADSHAPILYPAAVLSAAKSADAAPFLRFLGSVPAKAIFRRYGFGTR
ncbi:molybdate ABC transporter substrate-binding protein [Sphingomonas sp. BIUV-7]|uniref:Molybdate ABC transporter substrate-binding protein n=1 Tax=Sphingomonas natans TaxID=3063330 RepID=A0ABT8Y5B8_9SPHN|nr:molybdate ABC transporter substrate-binding protein [Sphingomonas sp. BIUV-7]MDO6413521.1 molybdate ABC transporter substrate-binding protein [Sphingomonas sp. BIUV-7]